jgi:hypothetical protein
MFSASEVLSVILEKPIALDHFWSLVTDDVAYVSLNYDNSDLRSIMPWCGIHTNVGPESIVKRKLCRVSRQRMAGDPSQGQRCNALSAIGAFSV